MTRSNNLHTFHVADTSIATICCNCRLCCSILQNLKLRSEMKAFTMLLTSLVAFAVALPSLDYANGGKSMTQEEKQVFCVSSSL